VISGFDKRGTNYENVWEHGNIGQYWKGTREQGPPLGDPQNLTEKPGVAKRNRINVIHRPSNELFIISPFGRLEINALYSVCCLGLLRIEHQLVIYKWKNQIAHSITRLEGRV